MDSPHLLVLRDRDTVDSLAQRMQRARRVAVVGNGGIAMELAFTLRGVEVICNESCITSYTSKRLDQHLRPIEAHPPVARSH